MAAPKRSGDAAAALKAPAAKKPKTDHKSPENAHESPKSDHESPKGESGSPETRVESNGKASAANMASTASPERFGAASAQAEVAVAAAASPERFGAASAPAEGAGAAAAGKRPVVRLVMDGLKVMRYGSYALNAAAKALMDEHDQKRKNKEAQDGDEGDDADDDDDDEGDPRAAAIRLCRSRSGWSTMTIEVDLQAKTARLLTLADHDREEAVGEATEPSANRQGVAPKARWHFVGGQ
jgi:hypothetical protein